MSSVKNFFSRIFLSKGDTGPTNEKRIEQEPGKRDSILKRIFRSDENRIDTRRESSELSRRHSDFTHTDLDDSNDSRTRMSLDGTYLVRTPAIHTGSAMRTSLQESTYPLENSVPENQAVPELSSEHWNKRRESDTRRSSSKSLRKSVLSLLSRRKSTELRREPAALNENELGESRDTLEELPSNFTGETLLSVFDAESTELKREVNYSTSRGLRNSLHCESEVLPSIPADLCSISSQ